MAKYVTVLGSTGSIGVNALDVIEGSNDLAVYGLSAHRNISLLERQVIKHKPKVVAVSEERLAGDFEKICREKGYCLELLKGEEGLEELAGRDEAEVVLIGVVGNSGIAPTLSAVETGKVIALANKEALVSAGELILSKARERNASIIPVDSEHSAIFQCLGGSCAKQVRRLILTASGGAFRGMRPLILKNKKAREALKHPTWDMGAKITIDSATLMNKGLEVIEAHWLFGVPASKIGVIVHRQSIIHSMVEFEDGSVLAQMGVPDMRFPIHYALNYPERVENTFPRLDLLENDCLTFEKPDIGAFPCLRLAYDALEKGGTTPCVLNEANQELVSLYLSDKIGFYDIPKVIGEAISAHMPVYNYDSGDLAKARQWAREFVADRVKWEMID